MDKELIEAMIGLTHDAPCKLFAEKRDSLFFTVESRSSSALNCIEGELVCDNFIETNLDGQIINSYDSALISGDKVIIDIYKQVHGKDKRDKLIVYNSEMERLSEFVNDDNHEYYIKLLDDEIRCIKDTKTNKYYNLDGTLLKR